MGKREEKIAHIIQQTIQLLIQEGIGGLSMRKVADLAQIRLSNLQYYFKDRNELLKATIAHYFKQCEEDILQNLPLPSEASQTTLEVVLREILNKGLIAGETNAQCAMFREIWALATRSAPIGKLVQQYYQQYCQWLVSLIAAYTTEPQVVVSLLLPYVEGYSIMGAALPLSKEQIIDLLLQNIRIYLK